MTIKSLSLLMIGATLGFTFAQLFTDHTQGQSSSSKSQGMTNFALDTVSDNTQSPQINAKQACASTTPNNEVVRPQINTPENESNFEERLAQLHSWQLTQLNVQLDAINKLSPYDIEDIQALAKITNQIQVITDDAFFPSTEAAIFNVLTILKERQDFEVESRITLLNELNAQFQLTHIPQLIALVETEAETQFQTAIAQITLNTLSDHATPLPSLQTLLQLPNLAPHVKKRLTQHISDVQ